MEYCGNVFTTIFYLIDAANYSKSMIRVLSENTGVFVLPVSGGDGVQGADGAVGHDNAGPPCLQLRHDLISICQSQDQWAKHLTKDIPG